MKPDIKKQTCFDIHTTLNVKCKKRSCRHWIEKDDDLNCIILSARRGPKTLQEIGDLFGLTRMRVCQIEKSIINKVKTRLNNQ